MEYRKLIKFGNSSHVVSIPKGWIKKHSLDKGDVIYFSENGESELILAAKENNERDEDRKVEINLEGKDFATIRRHIYSKYIAGYDVITFIGEKEIRENEEKIKKIINNLVALDVVEQTKRKIVIKDFIDTRIISVDKSLRRIDILIRSMLEDLKTTYKDDTSNLTRRDKEVNKLAYLILRTLKKANESPKVKQSMGLKENKMLDLWIIVHNLELFSDELKRVARYLNDTKTKPESVKKFFNVYEEIREVYNHIMKAWFGKDEEAAFRMGEKTREILGKIDKFTDKEKDIPLSQAILKLKEMATFIRNVARTSYE